MDHHQCVEFLGLLPERRERRIGQFLAGDIGENLDALELELLHAALKLLGGLVTVDHGHAAERDQPVGMLADIFGDAVIQCARGLNRDVEGHGVVDLRRPGRNELHVDAHIVHRLEADIGRANTLSDVGALFGHQRLGLGRREMVERDSFRIDVRTCDLGGAWHRDMGVHVDGGALRPRLAPRLSAFARRGRFILVPHVRHC